MNWLAKNHPWKDKVEIDHAFEPTILLLAKKKIVISVNAVSVDAANISPPKLETILNVSVHVGSVYEWSV